MWIVPALDEAKNRVMGRLSRMECLAIQKFAFQSGKEAILAYEVMAISDRSH